MVDDDTEEAPPEWQAHAIPPLVAAYPGSAWGPDSGAPELLGGCLPLVTPVLADGKVYTCVLLHVEEGDDGWYTASLYAGQATDGGETPEGMDPSSPIRAVREALRRLRFPGVDATGDQLVHITVAP